MKTVKILSVICAAVALIMGIVEGITRLSNWPEKIISVSESEVISDDDPVLLTAHRGVNALAPNNSLPAFQMAVEKGFYSVECDIRLTRDQVWVISHDENIKKWYNGNANVSESTYEELLKYKMKAGKGYWKYGDLKMVTLDQYLDLFMDTDVRPQIEIKTTDNKGLQDVMDNLKARDMLNRAIMISYTYSQLEYIRSICPEIEVWYLVNSVTQEDIDDTLKLGDNAWISCSYSQTSEGMMQHMLDSGLQFSCFTVDTLEEAEALYNSGFRYIETDRLCP